MYRVAIPPPDSAGAPDASVALSVVIACRNGAATLPATLAGVFAQAADRPFEVVFADNGSTDGSAAIFAAAARAHPHVPTQVVDASARPGKSFALNRAIAAARAPAVAFCDADDVPGEGWVAAMAAGLARAPIVAGRIDFGRLNTGWVRESRGGHQSRGLAPLAFLPELVHAGGGTLGLRRAVVEAVGGFDPGFPYLEDTEFCVRAQLAGFPIAFVPEAVMHVRARDELGSLFRQNFAWGRYEMRLVRRHRDRVVFAGGWARHAGAWRRLLKAHLRKGLRPSPATMLNAVWLRAGAGRLSGQLVGVVLERVPPYGSAPKPGR